MKVKFVFGDKFKQIVLEKYIESIHKKLISDIGIQVVKPAEFIHVTVTLATS